MELSEYTGYSWFLNDIMSRKSVTFYCSCGVIYLLGKTFTLDLDCLCGRKMILCDVEDLPFDSTDFCSLDPEGVFSDFDLFMEVNRV